MAITCPASSTAIYHHILFSLLLLFFACFVSNTPVHGAGEVRDGYQTFDTSSLLPRNKCLAPAGGGGHGGVPIRYNYGPCSRSGRKKSTTRIFLQDQSRVRSLNNAKSFTQYSTQESVAAGHSPHKPKLSLNDDDGLFLADVGIGTPRNNFNLIIDTGSHITWVQCSSSKNNHTYFNPSQSTSYSYGPCISSTDKNYNANYADKSYSEGVFGCDEVTLDSYVLPKFQFGCSRKSSGDFGDSSGVLGLSQGRELYSLLSQTASNFKKKFSYCLPPAAHYEGYLLFGDKAISSSPSLKFTPLLPSSRGFESNGYYFVEMIGISVAEKRLNISSSLFASPGTIIDSGTVITRLPTAAYQALRAAFQLEMLHCPSISPPSDEKLLDTCYNLKACGGRYVKLPEIVLHLGGEVDVSLDPAGTFWGYEDGPQACLAFAEISDDSGLTIIGNRQQVSLKVAYDIEGGRVGFGIGNGCMN